MATLEQSVSINIAQDVNSKNILTVDLGLTTGEYLVKICVNDNTGISYRRFVIQ